MSDDGTAMYGSPCTEACRVRAICRTCGSVKAPRGRSIALELASAYCHAGECAGYIEDPKPGHLFPGEELGS